MRNRLDNELDELNRELIVMGGMCEESISAAINAISTKDEGLITRAIEVDKAIDQKEREIESLCLKVLLSQQPVARDLRLISSALKMITDMERIGDQASDIAEIVKSADFMLVAEEQELNIMAKTVIEMLTGAIDAFVKRDVALARKVIVIDDVVDNYFDKIKDGIVKSILNDEMSHERMIDLLMIAKYLERIGDHATNIAEWVEFSITGVR